MKKVNISWQSYHQLVLKLSRKISFKPDIIICINRGGLVIGCLFSHILRKPLVVMAAESYQGQKRSKLCLGTIASTKPIKGKVLVVDDLVDSGETLDKVKKKIQKLKAVKEVKTACLFRKPWSKISPDYFIKEVDYWPVFPYENN